MYQLIIENGHRQGEHLQPSRREFTIGRNADNDLQLTDDGVSGKHCAIAVTRRGIIVRDRKSTNGVYVNGQRVEGQARLCSGDRVELGAAVLRFEFLLGVPNPNRRVSPMFGLTMILVATVLFFETGAIALACWMRAHELTPAQRAAVLKSFPTLKIDDVPELRKPLMSATNKPAATLPNAAPVQP